MIWLAVPPTEDADTGAPAAAGAGHQSENGPASAIGVVCRPWASAVRTGPVGATLPAMVGVADSREAGGAASAARDPWRIGMGGCPIDDEAARGGQQSLAGATYSLALLKPFPAATARSIATV